MRSYGSATTSRLHKHRTVRLEMKKSTVLIAFLILVNQPKHGYLFHVPTVCPRAILEVLQKGLWRRGSVKLRVEDRASAPL